MLYKPLYQVLFSAIWLVFMAACVTAPQSSKNITPTSIQLEEPTSIATSTIMPTGTEAIPPETEAIPTPTQGQISTPSATVVGKSGEDASNVCQNLGNQYVHNKALGEIREEYIGSWHAAPSVGSGYNERFVFFTSGNYFYFPSQYECDVNDVSCTPSPIEAGTWGVQGDQLNLAKNGETKSIRRISAGEVMESSADESPYPQKTMFGDKTYWLLSKETNLWNPETGEFCP